MFADIEDLQRRWRTLNADEYDKAELTLADVERDLRREFPDLANRIAVDDELALEANRITCNVVRRRLTSEPVEHIEQDTDTAGPYGRSRRYRDVSGQLELTPQERRILAGAGGAPAGPALAVWSNE